MSWHAEPARTRRGVRRRAVLLAACGIAAGLGSTTTTAQAPGPARDVPASDRETIRRVIARQIDAFRRDAAEEAFGFASPGIRALFGTADAFMTMVRTGYRPVHRPRSFAFDDLLDWGGTLVQPVRLVAPDGARVLALYDMERQPDGSWKIAGCRLVEPPAGDV